MPLETATYISDLVTSNPAHTDGLSQADSHARLIKSTLKATFPNFTAAVLNSTQANIDAAVRAASGLTNTVFYPGTSGAPGATFAGDGDTGFYSPGANQLTLVTGGTAGLLIDAAGHTIVNALLSAGTIAAVGAYAGGTGQLVPIGAVLEWYDDVLPAEGGYCWANGQIIASANTVCPVLLGRWGSRFGGNGTTTMGVPDRRDTVAVGKSTMGSVASRGLISGLTSWVNTTLGALFGQAYNTLNTSQLPPYTPAGVVSSALTTLSLEMRSASTSGGDAANTVSKGNGGGTALGSQNVIVDASSITSTLAGTPQGGTSTAVPNVQSSTTCNYILRLA